MHQVRTGRVGKREGKARTCGSSVPTANCVRYYGDELRQQHRRLLIVPNVQIKHQVRANKVQMTPTSKPHTNISPYNKCRRSPRSPSRRRWISAPLPNIRQFTTNWMLSFTMRRWNTSSCVVPNIVPNKDNAEDPFTEEKGTFSSTPTSTNRKGCREPARNRAVYRQTFCQERHTNGTQYTSIPRLTSPIQGNTNPSSV